MKLAMLAAVTTGAVGLLATSCGGNGATATRTVTVTAAATTSGAATASASPAPSALAGATYTDPTQMVDRLNAAGFECHLNPGDVPAVNLYGALSLNCFHGNEGGGTRLFVWSTPIDESNFQTEQTATLGKGLSYFGNGWTAIAYTPGDLAPITAALK